MKNPSNLIVRNASAPALVRTALVALGAFAICVACFVVTPR